MDFLKKSRKKKQQSSSGKVTSLQIDLVFRDNSVLDAPEILRLDQRIEKAQMKKQPRRVRDSDQKKSALIQTR
jgi:hypothetical protein